MEGIEPSGYLPFKVRPEAGDRLIFSPVYVFPVESMDRGVFSRLHYLFQTVLVNGTDGRTTIVDEKSVDIDYDFVPGAGQHEYLKLKVSPAIAPEAARFGAVPDDFRKWNSFVRHRRAFVHAEAMKLAWRVYIVRSGTVIDTFTGGESESAALVGMLFN